MKRYLIALLVISLVGLFNVAFAQTDPATTGTTTNTGTAGQAATDEAGLKLLIDFDVYQIAINNLKGNVVSRYKDAANLPDGLVVGQPIQFTDDRFKVEETNIYDAKDILRDRNTNTLDLNNAEIRRDRFGALEYAVTKDDMHLDNWLVDLNSSANTITNRVNSYCKQVQITKGSENGRKVLGIRIHFPTHHYNAFAKIKPPYPFLVYDAAGKELKWGKGPNALPQEATAKKYSEINFNNGVLYNVGQLKYLRATVSGRNYNNAVAVRLRDNADNVKEYFLGYLNYAGWRTLVWKNPNYISQVDHREIFRIPLYPMERPYIAFDSFIIYRSGLEVGGNFVCYIKDVWVDYDLAISPEEEAYIDIEDDEIWMILRDKYMVRSEKERKNFADRIELIKQEKARMFRPNLKLEENPATKHVAVDEANAIGSVSPVTQPK